MEAVWLAYFQKKAQQEDSTFIFIDESGLSERPSLVPTRGLRGQTPVRQQSPTWKQLSAIPGLSFLQFYFRFFRGAIRSEQAIEFLGVFEHKIREALLIILDGAAIHCGLKGNAWLGLSRLRACRRPTLVNSLRLERFGPISRTMHEIINLCLDNIRDLGQFARNRRKFMQRLDADHRVRKEAELAF